MPSWIVIVGGVGSLGWFLLMLLAPAEVRRASLSREAPGGRAFGISIVLGAVLGDLFCRHILCLPLLPAWLGPFWMVGHVVPFAFAVRMVYLWRGYRCHGLALNAGASGSSPNLPHQGRSFAAEFDLQSFIVPRRVRLAESKNSAEDALGKAEQIRRRSG